MRSNARMVPAPLPERIVGAAQAEPVAQLLACGANPDTQDGAGDTPLMLAAASGCVPCVQSLLPRTSAIDTSSTLMGTSTVSFSVRVAVTE